MGFTSDRGFEIKGCSADGQAGCRITGFFKKFKVAVGMACFAFCCGAENCRYIIVSFDVGLLCKIQITAVSLGFASKGIFQILFCFGVLK